MILWAAVANHGLIFQGIPHYATLLELAAEKRKRGETVEQAFARLYADPSYRDLVATETQTHNSRVTKALGVA